MRSNCGWSPSERGETQTMNASITAPIIMYGRPKWLKSGERIAVTLCEVAQRTQTYRNDLRAIRQWLANDISFLFSHYFFIPAVHTSVIREQRARNKTSMDSHHMGLTSAVPLSLFSSLRFRLNFIVRKMRKIKTDWNRLKEMNAFHSHLVDGVRTYVRYISVKSVTADRVFDAGSIVTRIARHQRSYKMVLWLWNNRRVVDNITSPSSS